MNLVNQRPTYVTSLTEHYIYQYFGETKITIFFDILVCRYVVCEHIGLTLWDRLHSARYLWWMIFQRRRTDATRASERLEWPTIFHRPAIASLLLPSPPRLICSRAQQALSPLPASDHSPVSLVSSVLSLATALGFSLLSCSTRWFTHAPLVNNCTDFASRAGDLSGRPYTTILTRTTINSIYS